MKTAREVAHAIVCERQDSEWCHWSSNRDSHAHYCDSLAAAIEARDAEHATEVEAFKSDLLTAIKEGVRRGAALKEARGALEAEKKTSATWETILNGEREHRHALADALEAAQKALVEIGVEWRESVGKCKWCGAWDSAKGGSHHGNCPTVVARDASAAIARILGKSVEESLAPSGATVLPPFKQAWARYKAKGYDYGEDALTNVEFGYEIAGEELARTGEAVKDSPSRGKP